MSQQPRRTWRKRLRNTHRLFCPPFDGLPVSQGARHCPVPPCCDGGDHGGLELSVWHLHNLCARPTKGLRKTTVTVCAAHCPIVSWVCRFDVAFLWFFCARKGLSTKPRVAIWPRTVLDAPRDANGTCSALRAFLKATLTLASAPQRVIARMCLVNISTQHVSSMLMMRLRSVMPASFNVHSIFCWHGSRSVRVVASGHSFPSWPWGFLKEYPSVRMNRRVWRPEKRY